MTKRPNISMQPIQGSSAIQAAGYDEASQTMAVQLHNGKVYHYDNVPVDRYAAFTGAESPGKFWNSRIKPNHAHAEVDPMEKK